MQLLVGLGNPEPKYRDNRHNLGWKGVERIALLHRLGGPVQRFFGQFGDGFVGTERVCWLLPATYMNLSGKAVAAAVGFYKLTPDQVVVLHDDIDLALGKVRIKTGGGNAGHNGLKSIQQLLGTPEFVRIRLGVGRPPQGMDPAAFVLNDFTPPEWQLWDPLLDTIARNLPLILAGEFTQATSLINQSSLPARPSASG